MTPIGLLRLDRRFLARVVVLYTIFAAGILAIVATQRRGTSPHPITQEVTRGDTAHGR